MFEESITVWKFCIKNISLKVKLLFLCTFYDVKQEVRGEKKEGWWIGFLLWQLIRKFWSLTSCIVQLLFFVFLRAKKFYHQIKYFSFIDISILLTSLYLRTHHLEMCSYFQNMSNIVGICMSERIKRPSLTPQSDRHPSGERFDLTKYSFANSFFVFPIKFTGIELFGFRPKRLGWGACFVTVWPKVINSTSHFHVLILKK